MQSVSSIMKYLITLLLAYFFELFYLAIMFSGLSVIIYPNKKQIAFIVF